MLVMSPITLPIIGVTTLSGTVSTVFISAGVSGLLTCLFGEPTWGKFWRDMGIGALTCLVSGCVSNVAKFITGKISVVATQLNKLWKVSELFIRSCLATGAAIIIENTIEGKSIFDFNFSKIKSTFFGYLLSFGLADGFN